MSCKVTIYVRVNGVVKVLLRLDGQSKEQAESLVNKTKQTDPRYCGSMIIRKLS